MNFLHEKEDHPHPPTITSRVLGRFFQKKKNQMLFLPQSPKTTKVSQIQSVQRKRPMNTPANANKMNGHANCHGQKESWHAWLSNPIQLFQISFIFATSVIFISTTLVSFKNFFPSLILACYFLFFYFLLALLACVACFNLHCFALLVHSNNIFLLALLMSTCFLCMPWSFTSRS